MSVLIDAFKNVDNRYTMGKGLWKTDLKFLTTKNENLVFWAEVAGTTHEKIIETATEKYKDVLDAIKG